MDDASLDADLEDGYAALRKLADRVDDLFRGLDVCAELQPQLAQTKRDSTICVCVLPEPPSAIDEITYGRASRQEHKLHLIDLPSCIMGVGTLEKAVARARGLALAAILEDFMERARNLGMQEPLAEFFSNDGSPPDQLYHETFLKDLS